MRSFNEFQENAETFREIGEQGGTEALALVASVMDANAASQDRLRASLYDSMEQDRDRWKARALDVEAQLRAVERRLMGLLFTPPQPGDYGDE